MASVIDVVIRTTKRQKRQKQSQFSNHYYTVNDSIFRKGYFGLTAGDLSIDIH